MSPLRAEIVAILAEGHDLTLATVRPDGAPQTTSVSYAAEGSTIYFGCGIASRNARNLAGDDRVSLTVDLLDHRKGFGHTDTVILDAAAAAP